MSFVPMRGAGASRAKAVCDTCGREEVVPCDYSGAAARSPEPNEGQILRKLTAQGWSFIKHRLRCPKCEAARRTLARQQGGNSMTGPENSMTAPNVDSVRKPTPRQEIEIIVALSAVYDLDAKKYRGSETDASVASAVDGCMPGWVAQIREEKFGPAGNEEADLIRDEIKRLGLGTSAQIAALGARIDLLYTRSDLRVRRR